MDFSVSEILKHFTPATWVIFTTLVVMSVLSVSVAINRGMHFMKTRAKSREFAASVAGALKKADIEAVMRAASSEEYAAGYLPSIVAAGLTDARELKQKELGLENLETVASAMDRAMEVEGHAQRRWMTGLATVASTAPFVGLLGTVIGIITALAGMASSGSGGLEAVAGGIGEALIMTAIGLFVAIPAVWLYNWANGEIESLSHEMGTASSEMLDYIRKNRAAI